MPLFRLFFLLICLSVLPVLHALAQGQGSAEPAKRVEIVTDHESGEVRIVIDGQPVVTIDAEGIHVTGDIEYTGLLRDTGGDAQ